jgi:isopentenyl-diphosphate Delta-isomerase
MTEELVVLLDADGRPCGTAPKSEVHTEHTPLHLGFSCYLEDDRGRLLLTRRAMAKKTWPGVWTNSVCGHPAPDETFEEAVRRRAAAELGVRVDHLRLRLPDFRYRAVDAHGAVENEFCPVFVGRVVGVPRVDPSEVAEWRWASWGSLVSVARSAPWAISPWAAEQVALMGDLAA